MKKFANLSGQNEMFRFSYFLQIKKTISKTNYTLEFN